MLSHSTGQPRVHNDSSAPSCATVCSLVDFVQKKKDTGQNRRTTGHPVLDISQSLCPVLSNPHEPPKCYLWLTLRPWRFTSFTSLPSELTRPFNVLESDDIVSCPCCTSSCFMCKASTRRIFRIFANEQPTYFFCLSHFEILYSGVHLAYFTGCACVCWQGLWVAFACHRPSCHDLLDFGRTAGPLYPMDILMS